MSINPPSVIADLTSIPKDETCHERSPMSGHRFIACGGKAIAIMQLVDGHVYACQSCALRNLRFDGGKVLFTKDAVLKTKMPRPQLEEMTRRLDKLKPVTDGKK